MTNFALILPCHIAQAMTKSTAGEATYLLSRVAQHKERGPICSDVLWKASSMAVRHSSIMQWMALEMSP